MSRFIAGFLAGFGLILLIGSSLAGLMGASYKGKIDEAKKAVDEVYSLTHSPKYDVVIEGLRLIETTAESLEEPARQFDSLSPRIEELKKILEIAAPLLVATREPLGDLSTLLQNPPPFLPSKIATNGRQLGSFLEAAAKLIPYTDEFVKQIHNLPTAPSEAVSRISTMASDAWLKLLEVRSKSEEAYRLIHGTGFQLFETVIGYWWIAAALGGILFVAASLWGGSKMLGIVAIVVTLCIVGADVGVALGVMPAVSPTSTLTPAPAPTQVMPSPTSDEAPVSLLLSEEISLFSYSRVEGFYNPKYASSTEGCVHVSVALALSEGQNLKLKLESDVPISWDYFPSWDEPPRTKVAIVFAEMRTFREEYGWATISTNAKQTKSVSSYDDGRRLDIILTPAGITGCGFEPLGKGLYKLLAINLDPSRSHYLKYTIEELH